ncbi:MAG TPA: energy-coupling factor transporter ATPase [Lachnospiraceae bacterium]|nr:energy-coupling factor transporter ATPase [Lachnospiraceae bacterium]
MAYIEAENVTHRFVRRNEEGNVIEEVHALDGVNLKVEQGSFAAVLGHNGSGKSTFARHVNVLLQPDSGRLTVNGMDTADDSCLWEIRQNAGMIFQNPDNQLVAGVVEEDVAFGPENIGLPTEEIARRVTDALGTVDMEGYRMHSPNLLSGGQKQRVAIAGVMAMRPDCMIFDESTAMLDPNGRKEVLETARRLNREEGVTVLWITHYMEEVVEADCIYVMDQGKVCMSGSPREIFAQVDALLALGLDVPPVTRLAYELRQAGIPLPEAVLTRQELAEAIAAERN